MIFPIIIIVINRNDIIIIGIASLSSSRRTIARPLPLGPIVIIIIVMAFCSGGGLQRLPRPLKLYEQYNAHEIRIRQLRPHQHWNPQFLLMWQPLFALLVFLYTSYISCAEGRSGSTRSLAVEPAWNQAYFLRGWLLLHVS